MAIHSDGSVQGAGDANRRLVRFFSICLSSLVFVYSLLAVRIFIEGSAFAVTDWMLVAGKVALGAAALLVLVYPAWLAVWLERHIDDMGAQFEGAYADAATAEKIRMIVLVTMVSLLLELVMIRWLASVFPVFSFFKNFTLLACFLGLGAGYAVSEKQPCAPGLVLPMLALFVGIITLLRYDIAATTDLFSGLPMQEQTSISIWMDKLNWQELFGQSVPLYLLLGTTFVLCACICYPIGQLCGKLLGSTDALRAYGLNLIGSIVGVAVLFVMSLFWLPPVVWFTAVGGTLLVLRAGARQAHAARRCELLPVDRHPVLAGADRHPAHLFAVSAAGEDGEVRRPDEHPFGRLLLPEGVQLLGR